MGFIVLMAGLIGCVGASEGRAGVPIRRIWPPTTIRVDACLGKKSLGSKPR